MTFLYAGKLGIFPLSWGCSHLYVLAFVASACLALRCLRPSPNESISRKTADARAAVLFGLRRAGIIVDQSP